MLAAIPSVGGLGIAPRGGVGILLGAAGHGPAAEFAPPPEMNIVVVDADGKGDYTSIGKALSDAKDGTTLSIKPGRYKEDALAVGHDVTIEADGPPGSVVIEMSAGAAVGIRSTAGHAVFRKLNVRGRAAARYSVEKGGAVVEDCRFTAEFPHQDGSAPVSVTTDGKVDFVRTRERQPERLWLSNRRQEPGHAG